MSEIQPQAAVAENVNKSKKRRNRGGKKKIKSTTEATNIPIVIQPPKLKSIQKESISSNWKSLLQTMPVSDKKKPFPRQSKKNDISPFKRLKLSEEKKSSEEKSEEPEVWFDGVDSSLIDVHKHKSSSEDPQSDLVKKGFTGVTRILAMDCEMVGIGVGGSSSIVARVSIVNHFGSVVYDTFVSPTEEVTDFRTSVSGVRPHHLKGAPSFKEVQTKVADIIEKKILVGHAIHNDLKVLYLSHPRKLIRDTSTYKPFRTKFGGGTPALKKLVEHYVGVKVQTGEHSSVQDAQAAVRLYTMFRKEWECHLIEKRQKKFANPNKKKNEESTSV